MILFHRPYEINDLPQNIKERQQTGRKNRTAKKTKNAAIYFFSKIIFGKFFSSHRHKNKKNPKKIHFFAFLSDLIDPKTPKIIFHPLIGKNFRVNRHPSCNPHKYRLPGLSI